jgi:2-polyprenyl-3-methyl-5-hydroxy-6-metoxy-1,4-benzoquinol methylase
MKKKTQKKLLKIVRENYNKIADEFNETRKKYLWPELIKLAGLVKNGDKILDAGCGNGRLSEAFRGKEINYVGVDNSEKLIKLARARNKMQVNIKFIVGDILELNRLPVKDFDFVFCVAVLHHLPGSDLQLQALKQMKEKIKSDGKIILTAWNLWSQPKFKKLIFKFWFLKILGRNKMDFGDILFNWKNNRGEILSQRYYHAFMKGELKKIIKKSGLKIEKFYKDKYNYYAILGK